jgi:hypothetical protein
LVVDSGGVLDLPEAGEQVDEDRQDVGRPGASSSTLISSSSGKKERLDAIQCRWLQLWTFTLLCCKFGQIGSVKMCTRERGRDWERNEGADSPVVLNVEREWPLVPAGSDMEFHWPGGVILRGRRGGLERRKRRFL